MMLITKIFKKSIYFRLFNVRAKNLYFEITLKKQLENVYVLNYILASIQNRSFQTKRIILSYIIAYNSAKDHYFMYVKISKRHIIRDPNFFDTDVLNVTFESCSRKVDSIISRCLLMQNYIASEDITAKFVTESLETPKDEA